MTRQDKTRQDKTRQDKTRQEPYCINLYMSNGKERPFQDRIYKIDTVTPAITTSYRPFYLMEFGKMENENLYSFEKNAIKTFLTNIREEGDTINPFNETVNKSGICPTITTRPEGQKTMILPVIKSDGIQMLGLLDIPGKELTRRVYSPDGLSPTLNTMQGGNRQPKIMIKQATAQGYAELTPPGVADLSFPSSTARRGRVQDGGATCPTLDTKATGLTVFETEYRIRKLTPLECWRLMGEYDEDFYKAAAVVSNSQLYKQAGNSIVVDVLEVIFKQLIY